MEYKYYLLLNWLNWLHLSDIDGLIYNELMGVTLSCIATNATVSVCVYV